MTLLTIVSHAVAALAGGGTVFVYLHKHQAAAIAASANLAAAVDSAKADLQTVKATVTNIAAATTKPAA
jgi:hypothetical protein